MRKLILGSVVCLGAQLLLAASAKVKPLNIKTGLWQITMTTAASGRLPIPPEMLAKMTPE